MTHMKKNDFKLGAAIRRIRRQRRLTQLQLADSLGISISYLNLIENNRRNVTGKLLVSLAKEFNVELSDFGSENDASILNDLMEVFSDEIFDSNFLKNQDIQDLVSSQPEIGRAIIRLYDLYKTDEVRDNSEEDRSTNISRSLPNISAEIISDLIQKNNKDEESALCMDCKQVAQYRKEDIYWCLGAKCDSPCVFNSKKPTDLSELTINHVIEDVDDISFLASWFNRILGLLPHCYCNSCKHVLLPDYYKADQTRPTVYRATYFSCANKDCSEKGNSIYLNHCSNRKCRVPIDSRLCKQRCENGFSICQHCYACCNQRIFDMKGIKKTGHQEGNEIFCPECGDGLMLSLYGENDFFCRKCKSKRSIKLAHISWRKWPELQKRFDIKFHKNVIKSLFKGTWN